MRVAIAVGNGNIGSKTAEILLGQGVSLTLLVRRPESVKLEGAQVVVGGVDDAAAVREACEGADALLWLTPPAMGEASLREFYRRSSANAVAAIESAKVARVVHVSSVGASAEPGKGTLSYVHDVELALAGTGASVMHLRPGYFLQNLLLQRSSIVDDGRLALAFAPDFEVPWISTHDIALEAAQWLSRADWTGIWSKELLGGGETTARQVAGHLSAILKRPVSYHQQTEPELERLFASFRMTREAVSEMVALCLALADPNGPYATKRTLESTTATTVRDFLEHEFG